MDTGFGGGSQPQPQEMSGNMEGNNPKLQTIKYVNTLPEGKIGNYTQNNRVDFMPDPSTAPYFDGAQSYLNIQVRNTSTFDQGNSVSASTAIPPMCFPVHVGANSLINRCVIRSKDNSQVIEDIEAYNTLNGIKNAYTNDSDIFKTLGRITGVGGRTPQPINQTVDNQAINYWLPNGETDVPTSNTITGGGTGITAQFCVPVESGLMSAFSNQHHVVPNLDVPLHFQFFLEKNNVALQTLYHKFYITDTINGVDVVNIIGQSPLDTVLGDKVGTEVSIHTSVCDTSLTIDGVAYSGEMCAFRVGQMITDGTDHRVITAVEINTGTSIIELK